MKECFIPKEFTGERLEVVTNANRIIAKLRGDGYMVTLRQVYYQLVAHDLFPDSRKWRWTGAKWVRDENGTKNAEPNYKWLGEVLNDSRLAGLTDWDAIEDRTRNLEKVNQWDSPAEIMAAVASQFRIDKWATQPNYVEVWVEKDALVGVLEKPCRSLFVPWFSCRGYTSQSELYVAAQRLARIKEEGRDPVIIHLGDHDPSGIDMSRDITDRLAMLARTDIEVRRIALNMDQVEQYDPPPNPAKQTDCRFQKYAAIHGDESWELDALPPEVIDELITQEVLSLRDIDLWDEAVVEEEEHRENLRLISDKWEEVAKYIERKFKK